MICNFFNKVRFLTNKLKLLIFMKKPFLHLHLSLLFLMGCVFLLPSCIEDKAEDAAHRLVVSKVDVELIQTGMLNTGSKASFDVLANRGYVITSDAEWLDVDKPTGKGRVSVTLEAKPNETAGERTGHLTVTSGKLSERVTVTQTLDPDPDDGNPVGYTDERETLRRDCCDPYRHPLDAAGESRCDRRRKRLFPLVSRQREDRESSAQLTAINSKSE